MAGTSGVSQQCCGSSRAEVEVLQQAAAVAARQEADLQEELAAIQVSVPRRNAFPSPVLLGRRC